MVYNCSHLSCREKRPKLEIISGFIRIINFYCWLFIAISIILLTFANLPSEHRWAQGSQSGNAFDTRQSSASTASVDDYLVASLSYLKLITCKLTTCKLTCKWNSSLSGNIWSFSEFKAPFASSPPPLPIIEPHKAREIMFKENWKIEPAVCPV